ncbi:MAG: Fic family protein [Bdellovibrionales bacterium]|nr:Fic family protein [Bdellovibrionales bacterium]
MKLTRYLTEREVLDLHARTIAQHGGAPGVRNLSLLQSSLYYARSGYYKSLSEQAAAFLQSFCMNHPFVDGNK